MNDSQEQRLKSLREQLNDAADERHQLAREQGRLGLALARAVTRRWPKRTSRMLCRALLTTVGMDDQLRAKHSELLDQVEALIDQIEQH